MTFRLTSASTRPQRLLVDVAVHFVKARGVGGPKVFTLGRLTLGPRERVDLKTAFSLAVQTTRVPRAGRHAVDVIVKDAWSAPMGGAMVGNFRALREGKPAFYDREGKLTYRRAAVP